MRALLPPATPELIHGHGNEQKRDAEGDELLIACGHLGLETDFVYRSDDLPTDRYMAIEGANGLIAAIADAQSLEAAGDKILRPLADGRLGSATAPWAGPIALDGNLTEALLAEIAVSPLFSVADLRVAPASPGKAERLRPLLAHPRATLYVNLEEANLLTKAPAPSAPAPRGQAAGRLRRRGDQGPAGRTHRPAAVPLPSSGQSGHHRPASGQIGQRRSLCRREPGLRAAFCRAL